MDKDILTVLFVFLVVIIIFIVLTRIAIRVRKSGGSMLTTMHGSTYEFLSKDNRAAVEEIIEVKANKKMEEQESGKLKK